MKKPPLTPEQLNAKAEQKEKDICTALSAFIFTHKIKKTVLAEVMGINQQNISRILDPTRKNKLHTLLLLQAGLEEITGIPFETPRFTRPTAPAVNAV